MIRPEVDEFIKTLSASFLHCRTWGHSWDNIRTQWVPDERCYASQVECSCCTVTKTVWISQTGHVISKGGYVYPQGYLTRHLGALTPDERDAIRLATLRSATTAYRDNNTDRLEHRP